MKKTKRVSVLYAAWEADKEAQMLSEQSEKGWQLVKTNIFGSKLVWDDSVRYVYQIDRKISPDARYYETFTEQGWEHVTQFNGWQYFRKKYDPSLGEEEYKIYTDEQTYADSLRKDKKTMTVFGIIYAVFTAIYALKAIVDGFANLNVFAAIFLLYTILFFAMSIQIGKKMKGEKTNITGKSILGIMMSALFVIFAMLGVQYAGYRIDSCSPYLNTTMTWEKTLEETEYEMDLVIRKADTYFLDLDFECEGADISVVIEDSEGKEYYRLDGSRSCSIENHDIELGKGNYIVTVTADEGCSDAKFYIKIDRNFFF